MAIQSIEFVESTCVVAQLIGHGAVDGSTASEHKRELPHLMESERERERWACEGEMSGGEERKEEDASCDGPA